jgi:hypothetical protein
MRKALTRVLPVALLTLAITVPARAAQDAASSPQAKAYQGLLKAVAAGDYVAYKKCMTKAANEGIEKQTKEMNLDPKKVMGMLQAMTPTDIKYTGLKVDGKKAVLDATGKVGGEANWGTINLEEEDGQWKIGQQSWTNTKK